MRNFSLAVAILSLVAAGAFGASLEETIYKTLDGKRSLRIVSDSEIELSQGGRNYVGEYTTDEDRVRAKIVISGSTEAFYFKIIALGLEDDDGNIFYSPAEFDKAVDATPGKSDRSMAPTDPTGQAANYKLPDDVPVFPGVEFQELKGGAGKAEIAVRGKTKVDLEKVNSFYEEELSRHGWLKQPDEGPGPLPGLHQHVCIKEERFLAVVLGSQNSETQIALFLAKKSEYEKLKRERPRINESAAIGNLRTIVGSQIAFNAVNGSYAKTFSQLTSAEPPYLEGDWSKSKSGYVFSMTVTASGFSATAAPESPGKSGERYFYVDETGVLRSSTGIPAGKSSPPLGMK